MTIPDSSWTEPFSSAKPEYPYNNARQTRGGHLFEMDDTPNAQRIRLQHGTANNFIEWQNDGTSITKIFGNGYYITMENNNVYIGGQCNITIGGPSVLHVKGDSYIQVDGNVNQTVAGDMITHVAGNAEVISEGDTDIITSGTLTLSADTVNINSDLTVNGSVSALGSVNSTTGSILAPLGVIAAGPLALVPTSLVPGNIYDTGVPIPGLFGSLASLRAAYDTFITVEYNLHTHVATGPSSPTLTPIPLGTPV
jgi:hypothetical protein